MIAHEGLRDGAAPGVSVVMATFNGARFLEEQLRSLADQTLPPAELIVSDDGSEDGTLDIVEEFRRRSPFPVVVRRNERRLGYGENFLTATHLATGRYIAYCDQDDVWFPAKLETAVETLDRTGADLFVHAAAVIDERGERVGRFGQDITKQEIHPPLELGPWSVFYGFAMVFPRELFELVDPRRRGRHTFEHQGLLSHDLWIYFLASSLGHVAVDDRLLAGYRRHGTNQTPSVLGGGLRAWTSSLGVAAHPALRRDEIAAHRAALMSELHASATEERVRDAAGRAADYWQRIARYEAARLAFYRADRPHRRATGCASLVRAGGYRPVQHGGLGRRLLAKDLVAGVVHARRRPR
jgi:glycosyltransferase involved in cell wall biosynthesis